MSGLVLFLAITCIFGISFLVFLNLFINLRKKFGLREFVEMDMAFAFLIALIITALFQIFNSKKEQQLVHKKLNNVEKIVLEKEIPFIYLHDNLFDVRILKNDEASELEIFFENGCEYKIFHKVRVFEEEPFYERKMLKYGVCQLGKELILN